MPFQVIESFLFKMHKHGILFTLLTVVMKLIAAKLRWDPDFLASITYPLFVTGQQQEVIWFLSEEMDSEATEDLQAFMVKTHTQLKATQMILTNRSDLRIVDTSNRKNSLSFVFAAGPNDNILDVHDKVMRGRHFYFNFIVAAQEVDNFTIIEEYLEGMRKRILQNSLLCYRSPQETNEIFGFNVYPEYSVQNRSNLFAYLLKTFKKVMTGGADVEGYAFPTPLRQDLPSVIRYQTKYGRTQVQGTSYRMLDLFLSYINGSIKEYKMPKDNFGGDAIDMKASLQLVRERKIPILAHAYALFKIDDEIDKSYPITVVRWCLMVPLWNSVSTYYYTLQPFHILVWTAWIAAFSLYLAVDFARIITLDGVVRRRSRGQLLLSLGESFLNNFCLFINIATMRTIKAPAPLRFIVFVALFIHGFFLSANYTSLLGSILTVTLFRTQINDLDDIINANLTVMITDYELEFLLADSSDLPPKFRQLLMPVDVATFNAHQISLNSSYAYFVTDEKWHFLKLQQQHLKQGLFKMTDICFGSYHLAFPMPTDSDIWRNLEYFMYRVHSSGLYQHYESTSFDYAIHAGLVKRFIQKQEYTSAGMEHFLMVYTMLAVFCGLGFVVLLFECLIYHISSKGTHHQFIRKGL